MNNRAQGTGHYSSHYRRRRSNNARMRLMTRVVLSLAFAFLLRPHPVFADSDSSASSGTIVPKTMAAVPGSAPARANIPLDTTNWDLIGLDMGEGVLHGLQRRARNDSSAQSVKIPNNVQLTAAVSDPLGQSPDLVAVNNKEWWYTRRFESPAMTAPSQIRLVFDGVDYFADVWLNGVKLGTHEGAYTRFEYDVSNLLSRSSDNYLAVRVTAPWKVPGRSHYEMMKGEYDEFWDALPGPGQVVFPLGLHRGVHLEVTARTRIEHVNVSTLSLHDDAARLRVDTHIASLLSDFNGTVQVTLTPKNFSGPPLRLTPQSFTVGHGTAAGATVTLEVAVPHASLWWTWDLGDQNLYSADVILRDASGTAIDATSTVFGIRTIERDDNLQYRLNGRKVLLRGAWYAMSRLYPASTDHWTYERDLRLARNANMNHLVNFTVVEKDDFYELADQLGILLFVELPFNQEGPIDALNDAYPRREAFLDWAGTEVRQIVKQLRNHPSVGVWAPVAEVTENSAEISVSWDQRVGEARNGYNLFLKRMRAAVEESDLDGLYFRSYCDFGEHHFWEGALANGTTYDQHFDASASFVSEYGAIAMFSPQSAAAIAPVEKLWGSAPLSSSPLRLPVNTLSFSDLHPWRSSGLDFTTTAVGLNVTRKLETYRDYANASQIYQAFLYGYAGDAYRRKAFAPINGIRSWMFKSFPEIPLGGFGVVDALDVPTRAYYEQKRTFAPITLSFALRTPLESVPGGTSMQIPIWVSNIEATALPSLSIDATLFDLNGAPVWTGRSVGAVSAYQAAQVGNADVRVPRKAGAYLLRASAQSSGRTLASAAVYLKVASPATRHPLRVLVIGSPEWANPVAHYAEGLGATVTRAIAENTVIRPVEFPASADELRRNFDVVWLAGYNSYWREAPPALTTTLLTAVHAGTTFVHSGSAGSFHGGGDFSNRAAGLDLTALEQLLPVVVNHASDVSFSSTFRTGKLTNPFAQRSGLTVSSTAQAPSWLRDVNWSGVDYDNYHILDAKQDSAVLLKLGEHPLLVTGHYGKGSTIAYLGFSPEGGPARDPPSIVLDRAILESPAKQGFAMMSAAILALASGESPPVDISHMIEERALPLYDSLLALKSGSPVSVSVRWGRAPDGNTVGHLHLENGDAFTYGLRLRMDAAGAPPRHSLPLWSQQYFDLLPKEIVEADVTVLREPGTAPESLSIVPELIGGRELPDPSLAVPASVSVSP